MTTATLNNQQPQIVHHHHWYIIHFSLPIFHAIFFRLLGSLLFRAFNKLHEMARRAVLFIHNNLLFRFCLSILSFDGNWFLYEIQLNIEGNQLGEVFPDVLLFYSEEIILVYLISWAIYFKFIGFLLLFPMFCLVLVDRCYLSIFKVNIFFF